MAFINKADLSSLIKEQIKNYKKDHILEDAGTVIKVGDGIALVHGLDQVMASELVIFDNGVSGLVMNLEENSVGVALLGSDKGIKEGTRVYRSNRIIEVPVGDQLLGRVINSLAQPIDGFGTIKAEKMRPIERVAPGVMARKSISVPLQTGILAIDSMIPIGRGQRELIIGDRQTGKSAIAIDTIINQKGKKVKCVYVAIGQKNSSVAHLVARLKNAGAMDYTVVVSATASELAPLQYIAPYTGVTIAEEWMENGDDVLIVYDDLSKHAISYRTLSLLLRRPPGREAYPGDVFYLHSRLLERSARLNDEHGGGSITALPIVETQAGDISAYIPTNIISITDGQIFLQSELFNAGQRPAIDSGLSVSRVGSNAQERAMKEVSSSLKIELANYRELSAFAQFGSDLDESTKKILTHGAKVLEAMKQPQYHPYEFIDQVLMLFTLRYRLVERIDISDIASFLTQLLEHIKEEHKELIWDIETNKTIHPAVKSELEIAINNFVDLFIGEDNNG